MSFPPSMSSEPLDRTSTGSRMEMVRQGQLNSSASTLSSVSSSSDGDDGDHVNYQGRVRTTADEAMNQISDANSERSVSSNFVFGPRHNLWRQMFPTVGAGAEGVEMEGDEDGGEMDVDEATVKGSSPSGATTMRQGNRQTRSITSLRIGPAPASGSGSASSQESGSVSGQASSSSHGSSIGDGGGFTKMTARARGASTYIGDGNEATHQSQSQAQSQPFHQGHQQQKVLSQTVAPPPLTAYAADVSDDHLTTDEWMARSE